MPTQMRLLHTLFSRYALRFAIISLFILVSSGSIVAKQLERGNHYYLLIDSLPERDSLYQVNEIESIPEFPGGMKAFLTYLAKNFKYPKKARENYISGRQIMQFVVEKDGSLTDIKVLKGLGSGVNEASVRLLKNSPKWKPGFQDGHAVRVLYTLPFSLNLSDRSPQ